MCSYFNINKTSDKYYILPSCQELVPFKVNQLAVLENCTVNKVTDTIPVSTRRR